jgi:hypothetical protein
MFISHNFRVIFVHIQKNAGNSIHKVFRRNGGHLVTEITVGAAAKHKKHRFATDIRDSIEQDVFDEYLKFCVVRNPFDRMVSWWSTLSRGTGAQNKVMRLVQEEAPTFDAFLRLPRDHESGLCERFYVNQYDYISSEEGTVLVDEVLRFETLSSDFAKLCKRLGLVDDLLEHLNPSIREKIHYRDYYDEATQNLIRRRFARDCEMFGYEF